MDFQSGKSFEKLRIRAFQPYQICIHVDTVDTGIRFLMHSMLWMLTQSIQTCTHISIHNLVIFNGFLIRKKFWKAENQGFSTILNMHACRYCWYRHKISNALDGGVRHYAPGQRGMNRGDVWTSGCRHRYVHRRCTTHTGWQLKQVWQVQWLQLIKTVF